MAVLKQRLHRRNAEGSYDVIRLETTADAVIMSETDNTTVGTKLNEKANKDKTVSITLSASAWVKSLDSGEQVIYKQPVTISGVTAGNRVDIVMDSVAYGIFLEAGASFFQFENEDGIVHAVCMDAVPDSDVTVTAVVAEVN